MDSQRPAAAVAQRQATVAVVGQPGAGTTTVFDLLAHSSSHTGAWPGTLIERRTAILPVGDVALQLVELPSISSLTSSSPEELLVRDYLIQQQPDAVIVVVDATRLERGLYLVAELVGLTSMLVVVLNMMDIARRQSIEIDVDRLQAILGLPVVPIVATRNQGVMHAAEAAAATLAPGERPSPTRPEVRQDHQLVLSRLQSLITPAVPQPYPPDWVALKLLEGDEGITTLMRGRLAERWQPVYAILIQHDDAALAIAGGRYEWIRRAVQPSVRQPLVGPVSLTDQIDRVATHPVGGILVLLAVFAVLFWLINAIGVPAQEFLEVHVVQAAADWVTQALSSAPDWLVGLLADGIISGAGTVLTLLPILIIFFALLALLEDCGYLARTAYVMDRYMHVMGLHGHCFLPLFLGFGCNVPAVLAARKISSPKARLLTVLVTPMVPCGARLAVLAVLAPLFFGPYAFLAFAALVALNLLLLIVVGVVLHEGVLGGEHTAFIIELPLYRMPSLRAAGRAVWRQTVDFLKGAGTVIVAVSVFIWALSTLPGGNMETSYLAAIGRLLAPIGALMGMDWQMTVALLTGFVRKENTLATLSVLYGSGVPGETWSASLQAALAPSAALAFLAVQMLFIPCIATVVAIHQETRSWRWTAVSVLSNLVVSLTIGIAVYQSALLLGLAG